MKPIVIQNIYNQFRHSVMQKLTKAVSEFVDGEFLWVNHLGVVMNRDELMDNISKGLINYEKWTSTEQRVRVLEDCAILTGIETVVFIGDGNKTPLKTFVTVVFVKRDSGWKLISGQSTVIATTII